MDSVTFLPEAHQYFVGEVELPSVTHICRFLSVDIAANAKSWLRDAAAARGTAIHAACEAIDYDMEPEELTPETAPYVEAYKGFLRDYRIKGWQGIEVVMGSLNEGFAGTADRIGMIDGRPAILDIKTGSTLRTAPLTAQLTGYAILHGKRPGLYGLHLKKDGTYTLRQVDFNAELWRACMTLHHALQPKRRTK